MRSHRRSFKVLAVVFCLALLGAGCGDDDDDGGGGATTTEGQGQRGGTVSLAGEQEPTSLNFLAAEDNAAWTQYVMELVWPFATIYQPDGTPEVNEEFVDIELTSEDPQVVVYTINDEAVWSDDTPITVDDFIYTWESQNGAQKGADGNPVYAFASDNGYKDIEKIEGTDNGKTVTVTFSKPYADYLGLFDPVFPKHKFLEAGGGDPVAGFNTGFKIENIVGKVQQLVVSGAQYVVTDYQAGASMTLERNEKYWGEAPLLDKIIVPWITDGTQQPPALGNNEVQVMFPQAQVDLVTQTKNLTGVESVVGFGTFWEHMDFQMKNTHLAQLPVRQAVATALDRQDIVTRLPGQFDSSAEVLNNRIYMPSSSDYEAHGDDYQEQDIPAAKKLLEDAGYALGGDGIYAKDGNRLSLRLVWRDPNPRRQQTAELVQSQLKQSGIEITLDPQPDFTFLDNRNFDIALFGWTGGTTLASTESIYVPGGGQNYSDNENSEIQDLYAQANVELDRGKRADLMNQVDEVLWEDMPTIPLFQVPEFLAWRDNVNAVEYNGYQGPTWNSSIWSLK